MFWFLQEKLEKWLEENFEDTTNPTKNRGMVGGDCEPANDYFQQLLFIWIC